MRPYGIDRHIFHVDLSSPAEIAKRGGTIYGSMSFDRRKGATFDGSSNYVEYQIPNTLLYSDELSIAVEFTPDFDPDDGNNHILYWSNTYSLAKAAGNHLAVYFGGTSTNIALGNYQAYWRTNERNVFVFASNGTTVDGWLNGNEIATGVSLVWSPGHETSLYVGATSIPNQFFSGAIKSLTIYNTTLTAQEAQDLYSRQTYTYQDKASVWLDMETQTVDSSGNAITKDRSRYGRHFQLGDGTTSSTFPSFENPGFDFDGTDDYLKLTDASGVYGNAEQSIVVCFEPHFALGGSYVLFDGSPYANRNRAYTYSSGLVVEIAGGSLYISISNSVLEQYWHEYGLVVFATAAKSGDTQVYVNGVEVANTTTTWSPTTQTDLVIGTNSALGSFTPATYYHFSTYPIKLTPTQIRELTSYLKNKYH